MMWEDTKGEHRKILRASEMQALELLKNGFNLIDASIQKRYKEYVHILFKLNLQLEAELLKPQIDIYKPCPKCKEQILDSWKRHDKCGWKQ